MIGQTLSHFAKFERAKEQTLGLTRFAASTSLVKQYLVLLAEGKGFEPLVGLHRRRFSRPNGAFQATLVQTISDQERPIAPGLCPSIALVQLSLHWSGLASPVYHGRTTKEGPLRALACGST